MHIVECIASLLLMPHMFVIQFTCFQFRSQLPTRATSETQGLVFCSSIPLSNPRGGSSFKKLLSNSPPFLGLCLDSLNKGGSVTIQGVRPDEGELSKGVVELPC